MTSPITAIALLANGTARPALALFAVATLAAGCSSTTDPDDIGNNARTGSMVVELGSHGNSGTVDPRVDEVWFRVNSVQAQHEENGWLELSNGRIDIDLMDDDILDLDGGIIGDARAWIGGYSRTYIEVVDAWIVVEGVEYELGFTGDVLGTDPFQPGLFVDESYFVDEGSTTTVSVAWNLSDNLSEGGDGSWSMGAATTATVDIAL